MNASGYEPSGQGILVGERSDIWTSISRAVPLLSLAGVLLYALGFIVGNVCLSVWHIYDPDPFRSSCVMTGLLFACYLVCATLPSFAYNWAIKHQRISPNRPRIVGLSTAVIIAGLLMWCYARLFADAESQDVGKWLRSHVFLALWLIPAFLAGITLRHLLTKSFVKGASAQERTLLVTVGPFVLYLLLVLFAAVWVIVPASAGGGRPVQKEVWFSKDAADTLQNYGLLDAGSKITGTVIKVPKLWVLYSRNELFVFCDDKTCAKAIQVSKDWVKSESWPLNYK